MPRGVILVDYTDQGRRTIKDSPDRAEASKGEAARLGVQVKDLFYIRQAGRMMLLLSSTLKALSLSTSSCRASVVRQRENEIYPGFLDRGDAQNGLMAI